MANGLEVCNGTNPDQSIHCRAVLSMAAIGDMESYAKTAGVAMPAEPTANGALNRIEMQYQPLLAQSDQTIHRTLSEFANGTGVGTAQAALDRMQGYNDLAITNEAQGNSLGIRRSHADQQIHDYLNLEKQSPGAGALLGNNLSNSSYGNYFRSSVELQHRREADPVIRQWGSVAPSLSKALDTYANYSNALRNAGYYKASERAAVGLDAMFKRLIPLN